jgi:hypothetical protein
MSDRDKIEAGIALGEEAFSLWLDLDWVSRARSGAI